MAHHPIDPAVRAAVEAELRTPHTPPRSRAAIARAHGVSTRTVQRWADELGLADPWSTADTRAATAAAADRRRAARSQLADELLAVEIPRLRARMAGTWEKTIVVPDPAGSTVERVDEDDATIARGLKDLHTALGIAVDKTIAIDKHDVQGEGDDTAAETLGRLFAGLDNAYRVLNQQTEDGEAP